MYLVRYMYLLNTLHRGDRAKQKGALARLARRGSDFCRVLEGGQKSRDECANRATKSVACERLREYVVLK